MIPNIINLTYTYIQIFIKFIHTKSIHTERYIVLDILVDMKTS